MNTFFLTPGTINLLALFVLGGIIITMFIINSYTLITDKDKILRLYNFYLITSLFFVAWNFYKLIQEGSLQVLHNVSVSDTLIIAVPGTSYILFFGYTFNLDKAGKFAKRCWQICLLTMLAQILYLLALIITGKEANLNKVVMNSIFFIITAGTLVLLYYSARHKNKSPFQNYIFYGSVLFYIITFISNLQEYNREHVFFNGISFVFIALVTEHLFFAVASANRIKALYTESANLRVNNYQYQLEIEKVTGFFSATIHQHDDTDKLLWDVAKNLIGQLGFEDSMIYLWNKDKTVLQQKAGYGVKGSMQGEINKNIYNVPKGKGIVGAAVESGKLLLVNDTSLDKRYFTADGKIMLSELCVPIIHNNEAMGAINTEHSAKNFYTDRHLQILTTIASMLADKIDMIEAQQQTREKEMEVLKLNKDLATSQLTTLRAQMNPHFIFNALNSIQQYVLQGNVVEANKYLSKFSKLQREVLNHSDQNFISLEKELEVLNLYLELEQLRFDGNFTYEIKTDAAIDDDEIKIPPMIIQPFVENSIWHGLMPKQGERWVHIHFELSSDDLLICTVTDNGIGRDASARLKQNGHGQHKSKGLSLVYDRLNILRQQYGQAFEVTIKDLVDNNNVPAGTEVKLHIYTG